MDKVVLRRQSTPPDFFQRWVGPTGQPFFQKAVWRGRAIVGKRVDRDMVALLIRTYQAMSLVRNVATPVLLKPERENLGFRGGIYLVSLSIQKMTLTQKLVGRRCSRLQERRMGSEFSCRKHQLEVRPAMVYCLPPCGGTLDPFLEL